MEKEIIVRMLRLHPELKVGEIAGMLGLSRNTLYKRINHYRIVTGIKKGRKLKPIVVKFAQIEE